MNSPQATDCADCKMKLTPGEPEAAAPPSESAAPPQPAAPAPLEVAPSNRIAAAAKTDRRSMFFQEVMRPRTAAPPPPEEEIVETEPIEDAPQPQKAAPPTADDLPPAPAAVPAPAPVPAAPQGAIEILEASEPPQKGRSDRYGLTCVACSAIVAVSREAWESCGRCGARHHATCWARRGACARCGSAVARPKGASETGEAAPARRSLLPLAVTFPITFIIGVAIGMSWPAAQATASSPAESKVDPSLPGGLARMGEIYRFRFEGSRRGEYTITGIFDGQIGTIRAVVKTTGGSDQVYIDEKPYRQPLVPPADIPRAGEEVLTISGRRYECTIYEVTGVTGDVRRFWFARQYPYLLKQTSDGYVQLELTEIEAPGKKP